MTKKQYISILYILIGICNTVYAQTSLCGKYLMTIQEKAEEKESDPMMTPVEITKNNECVVLQADGEEPEPIAQLRFAKDKVNMQFIDFLADCSGDYKIKEQTHDVFSLEGENKVVTLFPFEPDEISNREMGITGKWYLNEEGKEITLDFQLPNVVHVIEQEDGFTVDEFCFWGACINGEDVFITAVPIFNPFAGTLKQIHVKDMMLHFDYKGKHYAMQQQKQEKTE